MNMFRTSFIAPVHLLMVLLVLLIQIPTMAQDQEGRPQPSSPPTTGQNDETSNMGDQENESDSPEVTDQDSGEQWILNRDSLNRPKIFEGEEAILGLDGMSVEELIPFIHQATGKVIMPVEMSRLKTKSVTLFSETPIRKEQVIDLIFTYMRLNGVGVIEKEEVIIIGLMEDVVRLGVMPVLRASDDVMKRTDLGSIVIKIYKLQEAEADSVGEQLNENLPDNVTVTVDPNSNQIVVLGSIEFCQTVQQLINELDHLWIKEEKRTWRLAHSDATEISQNIIDLFEQDARTQAGRQQRPQRGGRPGTTQQSPSTLGPGPQVELRVTVNVLQNAVTVSAAPKVIKEIDNLVTEYWDRPRPDGTAKVYRLYYTDPIKMRDTLGELLGSGSGSSSAGARRAGSAAGSGQRSDVQQILSGIYKIEAYPDINSLIVICKTEESFDFLDSLIQQLDMKSFVGLPRIVELHHANAVSLAEEINALLAEAGSNVSLQRPGEGLSGQGVGDDSGGGGATTGGGVASGGGSAGTINFPWQRGRQREDQSPESSLIGKVRIVPIIRQNALAVLAPPAQLEPMIDIIREFDKPGRQVMIAAIITEVELQDDFAFGLRISNDGSILSGANPDYRLGGTADITGSEENPFKSYFDTSLLEASIPVNVVIQALDQKTNVRIIQEPRIFTADNQEAYFFDGQDIPFITNTTINTQGNPTDSFEYREVGVVLNVRPRITANHDVDMEINLELSSIVPGQTLFGGAIVDRRQTTTRVIVQNGQTVVISGILRESESKITRGLPLLSDIPFIGELFKSHEDTTVTTELIAFITPVVVENPSMNDTEKSLQMLEDLTRPVKEQVKDQKKNPDQVRERVIEKRRKLYEENESGTETPVDIDDL